MVIHLLVHQYNPLKELYNSHFFQLLLSHFQTFLYLLAVICQQNANMKVSEKSFSLGVSV